MRLAKNIDPRPYGKNFCQSRIAELVIDLHEKTKALYCPLDNTGRIIWKFNYKKV